MKVFPIGRIESEGDETRIVLDEAWRSGLKGLESYGHVQVLYWLDGCDTPEGRGKTVEKSPTRAARRRLACSRRARPKDRIPSRCPRRRSFPWMNGRG